MESPRLLCVTVVWNHRDRLAMLLRSLDEQSRRPDGVILVDAASRDGTTSWVTQNYPYVSVLRLFQHHGIAHAWRQGIRFALQRIKPEERASTWVLCVAPEMLLAQDLCAQLLASVDRLPDVGAVGPVLLQAWRTQMDEESMPDVEPTQQLVGIGTGLRRSFQWTYRHAGQGFTPALLSSATEVLSVPGLCALMRADVLELLTESKHAFENSYEELEPVFLDAGMRLRSLGKLSYVVPEALAWKVDYRGGLVGRERWSMLMRRERDRARVLRAGLAGWLRLQSMPWRFGAWMTRVPLRCWMWLTRDGNRVSPVATGKVLSWDLQESLWRWMKK